MEFSLDVAIERRCVCHRAEAPPAYRDEASATGACAFARRHAFATHQNRPAMPRRRNRIGCVTPSTPALGRHGVCRLASPAPFAVKRSPHAASPCTAHAHAIGCLSAMRLRCIFYRRMRGNTSGITYRYSAYGILPLSWWST